MPVEQHPINFRTYYKLNKDTYGNKKEEALAEYDKLKKEIKVIYEDIKSKLDLYEREFNIKLMNYEEFRENKYIDGSLLKVCKNLYLNKSGNYELKSELFDIYNYTLKTKSLNELEHKISIYTKILELTLKEYNTILREFYNEVQKKLILEGAGYVFEGGLGWTCFNRFKVSEGSKKRHIDYKKSKERKEQLIKEGKKIYNKEEAEWCKKNGIEYKAEDSRVFINNEYGYELVLISCKLENGRSLRIKTSDYRGTEVRGKTNEQLIEECNNDVNQIMNLKVDIRTKLNLCVKADKMLYLKFIRNDNQESLDATSARWKNR